MAKDFSQYDDNPVMSILSKAQQAKEEQEKISQQANGGQILQENTAAETAETAAEEEPVEIKKTLMNISIRESTKKDWKMFFLEHDLSMTQGIETAVEYLMDEVRKHNIKLSKGGITK